MICETNHSSNFWSSNAHYAWIGFLRLLWLKPTLQELLSLWFFLSDSFSIFTPLKCDKATWTIMPGCSPTSFLTAAVPSSLCLWVQNMCCSGSGCHWAGLLVCLSLSFPLPIPLSIRSWCSCCVLGFPVTAKLGTVALDYLITCFSRGLCIWNSTFTETDTREFQSPLDTLVICVLLIGFHW